MKGLRDISVLFLKSVAGKNCRLLDSTAASGIRGIRYAKETGIKHITMLDINKAAALSARSNSRSNKVKAEVRAESIQRFANTTERRFDIIDLDPFGSPVPQLHDLMKIIDGNGILMVTATDTAVLCGAHEAACLKTYHAKPLHNYLCKEVGLRILMAHVARVASPFNLGIAPMLSISDMHYMRIFLQMSSGAESALNSLKQTGFCTFCGNCMEFSLSKGTIPAFSHLCRTCGRQLDKAGPMWIGNLYDKKVVGKIAMLAKGMADAPEAQRKLEVINGEIDVPMFYSIPKLTKRLRVTAMSPSKVIERLVAAGFAATRTQFDNDSIKTDAASSEVTSAVLGR